MNVFRSLREQLALTQKEMAMRMGITRAYYGQLESGAKEPSATLLGMLELMRKEMELDRRLAEIKEEQGAAYPVQRERKPGDPLIADPNRYPGGSRASGVVKDVEAHVAQLVEAAREDANAAAVVRHLLRKHLPLSDLDEYKEVAKE